jgi:hypothetical protein
MDTRQDGVGQNITNSPVNRKRRQNGNPVPGGLTGIRGEWKI